MAGNYYLFVDANKKVHRGKCVSFCKRKQHANSAQHA